MDWIWNPWLLFEMFVYMNIGYLLMSLNLSIAKKSTYNRGYFSFQVSWNTFFLFPLTTLSHIKSLEHLINGRNVMFTKNNSPWAFISTLKEGILDFKLVTTFLWPFKIIWMVFIIVCYGLWKVFTIPACWLAKA